MQYMSFLNTWLSGITNRLLGIPEVKDDAAADDNEALAAAAYKGDLEVVNSLLEIPAVKKNAAANDNKAFAVAAQNGHLDIVDRLLEIPVVKENAAAKNNQALTLAIQTGHSDIVNRLLEIPTVKENAAAEENRALVLAVQAGHFDIVNRLLEIPAVKDDAAVNDNEALAKAAENGHLDIVSRLLEIPAVKDDAAVDENKVLVLAVQAGHLDIVNSLLEIPAVKDNAAVNESEALAIAVKNGHFDIVSRLLEIPAINDAATDYNEALVKAAYKGDLVVVNSLLEIPAVKKNAAANDNKAFAVAAQNGHLDIVNRLLEIPVVKENAAAKNNKALILAIQIGHSNIVNRLLEIPAIKENAAAEENRALVLAVQAGHFDIVNRLLEIPAVKDDAAINGNEALAKAAENGHLDIVSRLLEIPAVKDDAAINGNDALVRAIQNNHLDIVNSLLEIPTVKDNAAVNENEALVIAAENGHLDIVNRLLEIPTVKDNAAVNENEALAIAVENGHLDIVNRLLEIPMVNDDAANNNRVLAMAVQNGHLDIVSRLLEIPAINDAANNNRALFLAVQNGHLDIVNRLLEMPAVNDDAANNNMALVLAVQKGHLDIANRLLEIPTVRAAFNIDNYSPHQILNLLNIPIVAEQAAKNESFIQRMIALNNDSSQCLQIIMQLALVKDKVNLVDVFRLAVKNEPYIEHNIQILFEQIQKNQSLYGLNLNDIFEDSQFTVESFKEFLENPAQYLEKHPPSPALSAYQIEAVKIIWLTEEVRKSDKDKMDQFVRNTETSMEVERVQTAQAHFEGKIKPYFQEKFDSMGTTPADKLINIEREIRRTILNRILIDAKKEGNTETIDFINTHQEHLMDAEDTVLMDQARTLFSSNENADHIAWRAYDKFAPTKGHFANLLTPQQSSSKVYSGAASDAGQVPLNEASNEVRLRAAYYYLAATDESTECTIDTQSRIGIFIVKVAELRRAYNDHNDGKEDKPSCYPGTLGRLADTGRGHPIAEMPPSKIDILIEFILSKRGEKLAQVSTLTHSSEGISNLFHGLTGLYDQTAQDVLSGKGIDYNQEYFDARRAFIASLGDENTILIELNEELAKRDRPILQESELIYLKKYLTDISCIKMDRITDQLRSLIEYDTALEEEVDYQEKADKGKEKESKVKNPYTENLRQRALLTAFPQRVQTLEIKERIFEKMSAQIQRVLADTLPTPLSNDTLSALTKTLIDELWEPSQNACSEFSTETVKPILVEFAQQNSEATILLTGEFDLTSFCKEMNTSVLSEQQKNPASRRSL